MGLIAGIQFDKRQDELYSLLKEMIHIQKHRDDSEPSIYVKDGLAIGMANRYVNNNTLPDSNFQNNQQSIHAFIDGIVLNIDEVIDKLNIVSLCSTDIIVSAYKKWGEDFVKELEGEFSCVIYDELNGKLILMRDPYGHKPLHYYFKDGKFIFSSEIKGILATGISKEVDSIALSDLLSLNRVPYPGTIFKNIYQVPPGGMVIKSRNDLRTEIYWDHEIEVDEKLGFEDAVVELEKALRAAIRKRITGKEVYCFLSGGLDSSAIVSFASELTDRPINAVCVGFEDEEYNEIGDAKIMANHVGAKLHEFIAQPDSFFNMLDILIWHHDIPFYDTSAYPTYYAGKVASSITDTILTGDGPDQILGGTEQSVAIKSKIQMSKKNILIPLYKVGTNLLKYSKMEPVPSLFSKIHRKLEKYSNSFYPTTNPSEIVKRYICSLELLDVHLKNRPERHLISFYDSIIHLDDINREIYKDVRFYIPDGLMVKVDRMCMAHGLETLSPFQDREISSLVKKMPGKFKINFSDNNNAITKYALRKICEKRLPEQIFRKKNQGFAIPLEKWLLMDQGSYLKEVLLDIRTKNRGYFKPKALENFVNTFVKHKGDWFYPDQHRVVLLLILELWHRKYID